jgi:ubiquitin-small subunit ribosomal protein S27Ae
MAEKKAGGAKKGPSGDLQKLYQVKDGQVLRLRQHCPKCGPGIFMAQHKDRTSCGNCGHTEFKKA